MKKLYAFTLAEVLLTMSIVGAVAAMTIPTLHYNRVKKEYTAKLKNFYSHMESAIMDMELDKGSFRDMTLPEDVNKGFNWYMDNIDPYMGHQYVNTTNRKIYYKDGSLLNIIFVGGCLDVDYDVNGDKGPNSQGFDTYRFLYCFDNTQRTNWFGNKDIFFGTYGSGLTSTSITRDEMIEKCKTTPHWCTKLLQNDQWEYKGDYPNKF